MSNRNRHSSWIDKGGNIGRGEPLGNLNKSSIVQEFSGPVEHYLYQNTGLDNFDHGMFGTEPQTDFSNHSNYLHVDQASNEAQQIRNFAQNRGHINNQGQQNQRQIHSQQSHLNQQSFTSFGPGRSFYENDDTYPEDLFEQATQKY